jgi:serine/threonine protein kinase
LGLREIYEDDEFICLVLDFQEGGSLMDHLENNASNSESEIKIIIEQLLLAVDFLHQNEIIHRDLKPDNILINKIEEGELNIKIADLGLAVKIE